MADRATGAKVRVINPDSPSKSSARSYTDFYKGASKSSSSEPAKPGYTSRPRRFSSNDDEEDSVNLRKEALRRRLGISGKKPKKTRFKGAN